LQRNVARRPSILAVPKQAAVPWVEKADYGRLRQVMTDDALPPTFVEWLRRALDEERLLYLNDVRVTRVLMTAETFLVWSQENGLVVLDAAARSQFAADQVKYRLRQ
jgi:hypothetical protein